MTEPKTFHPEDEHYWEGGWKEHEHLQLQRLARLPLSEKLKWLEEAHHVVLHLAKETSNPRKGPS